MGRDWFSPLGRGELEWGLRVRGIPHLPPTCPSSSIFSILLDTFLQNFSTERRFLINRLQHKNISSYFGEVFMLIKRTPDAYEKLQILGGMASDDILTSSPDGRGQQETRKPYSDPRK